MNLSSGTVEVTANAGKEITTNDGQNQNTVTIDGKCTFALGGSYTDDQGVEHYNDDIQLKVTPPTGGALKSLTVSRTAGKGTADTQTFDKEADALVFIKNAVKEYANVEISAEFEMNVSASQSDAPSTSFKITKEVIGGEAEKPFDFTVELYSPGGNTAYSGSFLVNGITQTYTGPFTVSVAGGGEAIIGGLPVGVGYKIVEETPAGWINLSGMQMGTWTGEDIVRDGMVVTLSEAPFKNLKIPPMSYTMEKERVTPAKLKPGTTDKYGFEKGDEVEYAVTIKNTGNASLSMDVTDVFADPDKFSNLSVKSVEGDGVVKNTDLTGPVGVNITIEEGKTATVTFTATVATDVELLSGAAADDGKGYENTAETSNVKGMFEFNRSTYVCSSDPQRGEEQYPDNPDGTNPLDDKKDTANTPVKHKTPVMSYTMEKERVTLAKLKPDTTDKYGFEKGDEVEYAVTIKNTGNASLSMDVTDVFADMDKFTGLSVKSVEGDGIVKNSDLTGSVGVNITIPAGKTATVIFTATVETDIELLSGSEADDGKGHENTAETSNVKGTYTDDDGNKTTYSADPKDGEEQYPDNPDGTNPLDDKKDTANTPVFAEEPPTPPVDPEEPKTPDPGQPEDTAITAADNVPKTSDNTDIASWLTVVGTALCGLIASIFMSKRQQQKMKRDQ